MTCVTRRSLWLVAFYAIAAALPVAVSFVQLDTDRLPLMELGAAPALSGMMMLTLYAGLGSRRLMERLLSLIVGLMYLTVWPIVQTSLMIRRQGQEEVDFNIASEYFNSLMLNIAFVFVLTAMFAIARRWFEFRTVDQGESTAGSNRLQFSVFHLLVLMSGLAVILTLMRSARGSGGIDPELESRIWVAAALVGFTMFANTICAAFAALGQIAVRRKCVLVIVTSILLGVAFAVAVRHDEMGPITFVGSALAMASPAVLVLASLLWLRPCGLRLVRRAAGV